LWLGVVEAEAKVLILDYRGAEHTAEVGADRAEPGAALGRPNALQRDRGDFVGFELPFKALFSLSARPAGLNQGAPVSPVRAT
jgi:hypothetical protein